MTAATTPFTREVNGRPLVITASGMGLSHKQLLLLAALRTDPTSVVPDVRELRILAADGLTADNRITDAGRQALALAGWSQ